jgi:hypothetical protein
MQSTALVSFFTVWLLQLLQSDEAVMSCQQWMVDRFEGCHVAAPGSALWRRFYHRLSLFHHELHFPHGADIGGRIALHRDKVR